MEAVAPTGKWKEQLDRFRSDRRYRIESLCYIRTQTRKTIRLQFNEAQVKLYEADQWFKDRKMPSRLIICKARRAGLSTGVEALIWDATCTIPHTDSLILSHQLNPSENVLGMCRTFWEHMPKAIKFPADGGDILVPIRPDLHRKYQGNIPSDKIELAPPLSSRIFIATAKSIDAFRSFAFQNVHATEAGFYDDAPGIFTAISSTVPDDPLTGVYVESSPNGMGGKGQWFFEECMKANDNNRNEPEYGESRLVFIPWHALPKSFMRPFDSMENRSRFERSLSDHEKDMMRQYDISLEQMNWYRARLAQPPFNRDEERFLQEYPTDLVTCFLTSGTMVFSRAAMQHIMLNTRRPLWEGEVYWGESDAKNQYIAPYTYVRRPHFLSRGKAESQGFEPKTTHKTWNNLKVWKWPEQGDNIIIGADVGKGNPQSEDGDYSTICVLKASDNPFGRDELLMTWRGRVNPHIFGDICASLAWEIRYRVGDKVTAPKLVIEWTGPGTATCTYIDERRLYQMEHYRMPGVEGMPKSKHIGWESNGKTKPFAVSAMVRAVEGRTIDIWSEELAEEMAAYRQHGAYASEADFGSVGTHDDLVSSFQIAHAVMRLEAPIDPDMSDKPFEIDMESVEMIGDAGGLVNEPFDEFAAIAANPLSDPQSEWGSVEPFDEMGGYDY